jgi:hypothetical protein
VTRNSATPPTSGALAPPGLPRSFDTLVSLLSSEGLTGRERLRLEIELVLSTAANKAAVSRSRRAEPFHDRRGAWARRR